MSSSKKVLISANVEISTKKDYDVILPQITGIENKQVLIRKALDYFSHKIKNATPEQQREILRGNYNF